MLVELQRAFNVDIIVFFSLLLVAGKDRLKLKCARNRQAIQLDYNDLI